MEVQPPYKNSSTANYYSYFNELIEKYSLIPFFIISCFTLFVIYIASLAYMNTSQSITSDSKTMLYYLVLIVVPTIVVFMYIINKTIGKSLFQPLVIFSMVVAAGLLILFMLLYSGLSGYIFNQYLVYIILACIFIVGLSIVFNIFSSNLKRTTGWWGFTINLVFYIPCLVSDFTNYLLNDVRSTQSSVFMLFILELVLILLYIFVLPRAKAYITGNGITLLNRPVFISSQTDIGYEFIKNLGNRQKPPDTAIQKTRLEDSPYSDNYALSMWIYLNPMPTSKLSYTSETTVFNYSDPSGNGHPRISYINDVNGTDHYNLYFSSTAVHQIELPHQKWNNFVFNYHDNSVDVFVNGNLERTFIFSENDFPKYGISDTIYVGSETTEMKGLYGSICNVVYYPIPMTKRTIITNYNLLSIQNPPLQL